MTKRFLKVSESHVTQSAFLVYVVVWVVISRSLMEKSGLKVWLFSGALPGAMYCLGQFKEYRKTGHCYLSADPAALPMALAGTILVYFSLLISGALPEHGAMLLLETFVFSFGIGHVVALFYAMIMTGLFVRA